MDDLGMCAFCRVIVAETVEEMTKRIQIQVKKGNAGATSVLARYYAQGENGFPIDHVKSSELLLKAALLVMHRRITTWVTYITLVGVLNITMD